MQRRSGRGTPFCLAPGVIIGNLFWGPPNTQFPGLLFLFTTSFIEEMNEGIEPSTFVVSC